MLSWCKILPLDGFSLNRAKKVLMKHKGACKSFWSRIGSLKSFTLTIPWNLANSCADISWNHRTSALHRSETNGIADRAVRRTQEGTSAELLQSGLDEKWLADSKECCCCLRNVQDLFADGKTPYQRRFGESFKGAVIPFGAMVVNCPISTRDNSRLHQFGGYAFVSDIFGRRHRSWRPWTRQKSIL